jgi:hypothetical protein
LKVATRNGSTGARSGIDSVGKPAFCRRRRSDWHAAVTANPATAIETPTRLTQLV